MRRFHQDQADMGRSSKPCADPSALRCRHSARTAIHLAPAVGRQWPISISTGPRLVSLSGNHANGVTGDLKLIPPRPRRFSTTDRSGCPSIVHMPSCRASRPASVLGLDGGPLAGPVPPIDIAPAPAHAARAGSTSMWLRSNRVIRRLIRELASFGFWGGSGNAQAVHLRPPIPIGGPVPAGCTLEPRCSQLLFQHARGHNAAGPCRLPTVCRSDAITTGPIAAGRSNAKLKRRPQFFAGPRRDNQPTAIAALTRQPAAIRSSDFSAAHFPIRRCFTPASGH